MAGMTTQTKIEPGDLVYTHPQDNPEHIRRIPSYAHLTPYLVLSVDQGHRSTSVTWFRLMSTSKVTGEKRIVKLPESMLSPYEELL
jgi:hypothetical protein